MIFAFVVYYLLVCLFRSFQKKKKKLRTDVDKRGHDSLSSAAREVADLLEHDKLERESSFNKWVLMVMIL